MSVGSPSISRTVFRMKSLLLFFVLVVISGRSEGSWLMSQPFDDFGLWHRNNFLDFVNWDPFEDDPLETAFFHNRDPYFPRIHRTIGASHRPVSYPLVKRNDEDVFKLVLDVNGFDPNELSLKLAGRELLSRALTLATGKHRFLVSNGHPAGVAHSQTMWI